MQTFRENIETVLLILGLTLIFGCIKKKVEPEVIVLPRYELPDFGDWEEELDGLPEDTASEEAEE